MAIEPVDRTSDDPDTGVKTGTDGARTPAIDPPAASERRVAHDPSDVITGPVGSARLKDPAAPGSRGADLEGVDSTNVASTG